MKENDSATTISSANWHNKTKTFYGDLATSNAWTDFFELPEFLRHSQQNTFVKIFAKLQNKLMLLSYLEAERFVLLVLELMVPIEERIAFWNEKKLENMRKW